MASSLVRFCVIVGLLLQIAYYTCNAVSFEDFIRISKTEKQKLDEFKTAVKPLCYLEWMEAESFLIRFLRVRNFDVEEATKMFKDYVKYRKDNKIDTIHSEDWSDIEYDYPYTKGGFDRQGRPVVLINVDEWNIRKAAISGKLKRLNRYFERIFDEIEIEVRKQQSLNNTVVQGVLLADLTGVNAANHVNFVSLPFYVEIVNAALANLPLLFDTVGVLNTPQIFNVVLNAVIPLMDPFLRDAFHVFGKNRETWVPFVRERVDPNQLPRRYGGFLE